MLNTLYRLNTTMVSVTGSSITIFIDNLQQNNIQSQFVLFYMFVLFIEFYMKNRKRNISQNRNFQQKFLIKTNDPKQTPLYITYIFFINSTLCICTGSCNRVGKRNLVLRHSVPHFCRILEALCVKWRYLKARFALISIALVNKDMKVLYI